MSCVLGKYIHQGQVMKIADDLYVGSDSVSGLLQNWELIVLNAFDMNDLRLSPSKAAICHITTTILRWFWTSGTISISPHKINPLSTCSSPSTLKGLPSWCGAYKQLKACISKYSPLLSPIEAKTARKFSN